MKPDLVVLYPPNLILDVTICIITVMNLKTLLGRLLTSSNKTIDVVEFVISPDLLSTLHFRVYIDQSKMLEELGDAFHIEFVMIVIGSIDRAFFCCL